MSDTSSFGSFDHGLIDPGDAYAEHREMEDIYVTEHVAQQTQIDDLQRGELLEDARAEYFGSLYPTNFVATTETAFLNHYTNPPVDTRNQIFIAEAEGVVGVSAREYIIAVTDDAGTFASPDSLQDVTATIQQLDIEPHAIAHALDRAEQRGLDLNPVIANHPAIDAARAALDGRESVLSFGPDALPPSDIDLTADADLTASVDRREPIEDALHVDRRSDRPPAPVIDPTVRSEVSEVVYSYNPQLESFQATVWGNDGPHEFGTSRGEYLTVESLHNAVTGLDTNQVPEDLAQLEDQVRANGGDFTIVGLKDQGDPRLFAVTPNHSVIELTSDGEYSPHGFNWGYDGSGPAQTTKAILEVTHGPAAAESGKNVRALTGALSAKFPDSTFTISGSDLQEAIAGQPENALTSTLRPDANAVQAVRTHLTVRAPEVALDGAARDLGPGMQI